MYGVGFGVWAVPGREGGTEGGTEGGRISVAVLCSGRRHGAREGGMERGSEGGKGKGRERECVWQYCVLVCLQKTPKETQLHRNCAG